MPLTVPTTQPTTLQLDDRWAFGPGILHGGFLLELLAGHAVTELHPHPLATSAHFLHAVRPGPAEIAVEVLRTGRSTSTARVRLAQGDRLSLDVVVTAGRLERPGPPLYADLAAPALPPLEECVPGGALVAGERNGITDNVEQRLDPATVGWRGEPREHAEIRGWLRSATGREVDALFLLCLADALPPVPYALGHQGWVPTVELTVHLRALPAPGWVRARQTGRLMQDGWLDEACDLWDADGHMVAQALQLAGYRRA